MLARYEDRNILVRTPGRVLSGGSRSASSKSRASPSMRRVPHSQPSRSSPAVGHRRHFVTLPRAVTFACSSRISLRRARGGALRRASRSTPRGSRDQTGSHSAPARVPRSSSWRRRRPPHEGRQIWPLGPSVDLGERNGVAHRLHQVAQRREDDRRVGPHYRRGEGPPFELLPLLVVGSRHDPVPARRGSEAPRSADGNRATLDDAGGARRARTRGRPGSARGGGAWLGSAPAKIPFLSASRFGRRSDRLLGRLRPPGPGRLTSATRDTGKFLFRLPGHSRPDPPWLV